MQRFRQLLCPRSLDLIAIYRCHGNILVQSFSTASLQFCLSESPSAIAPASWMLLSPIFSVNMRADTEIEFLKCAAAAQYAGNDSGTDIADLVVRCVWLQREGTEIQNF